MMKKGWAIESWQGWEQRVGLDFETSHHIVPVSATLRRATGLPVLLVFSHELQSQLDRADVAPRARLPSGRTSVFMNDVDMFRRLPKRWSAVLTIAAS